MADSQYKLLYRTHGSEDPWKELIFDTPITIGRNPDCDLVLTGAKISRQHARIFLRDKTVMVQDLNSSNGSFLDDRRLTPMTEVAIPTGALVRVGDVDLKAIEMKTRPDESGANQPEDSSILWYRIERGEWKQVPFGQSITIGRDDDCGLALDEGHVSRKHCMVSFENGTYTVSDLGSHNGTYLEGNLLSPNTKVTVYPGQYFTIGHVSMTISSTAQQQKYQKTADDVRHAVSSGSSAAQSAVPRVVQAPQKKSMLPWVLGIGAVFMMCVCGSVLGLLILLNNKNKPAIISEVTNVSPTLQDFSSSTDENTDEEDVPIAFTQTPEEQEDAATPEPIDDTGTKWLVMLYEDGDDEVLEYDIVFDVNTAEYIGSSDDVKIVTQLDRYNGAYDGDGDWSGARRFEIVQDNDLDRLNSPLISDMGETDSGDVQTLVDFAVWAIENYPAEHYVLILSDHGGGWFGGYTDGDNGNTDGIYLPALDNALDYIVHQTGIGKLDIFGFDACLMAQLEVWSVVAPYADIGIGSEETESATGWAYAGFLGDLTNNPDMSPRELAESIVDTFVEKDMLYEIRDEDPDYAMSSSTLSAIDLQQISAINQALNNLASALQYADQSDVAEARTYAMSYVLFSDYDPFFLDLVNFGEMACSYTGDSDVCNASDELSQAVSASMIAEKHGYYMDGSNGITFYFPDSSFFEITADDSYGFAYRQHAGVFASQSLWDEFLDYHYLGRSLP